MTSFAVVAFAEEAKLQAHINLMTSSTILVTSIMHAKHVFSVYTQDNADEEEWRNNQGWQSP